jgi:hypothetical protein
VVVVVSDTDVLVVVVDVVVVVTERETLVLVVVVVPEVVRATWLSITTKINANFAVGYEHRPGAAGTI